MYLGPNGGVSGRLESRYGRQDFSGWLELLGTLETLVDRARAFPEAQAKKLIADRNYQDLDQFVIEHLLGI